MGYQLQQKDHGHGSLHASNAIRMRYSLRCGASAVVSDIRPAHVHNAAMSDRLQRSQFWQLAGERPLERRESPKSRLGQKLT